MNMFTQTVTIYHEVEDKKWLTRVINDVHVEKLVGETIRKHGVEAASKLIAYIPLTSINDVIIEKGDIDVIIEKGDIIYDGVSPVTAINKANDILYHKDAFLVTSAENFDFGDGQKHIEVVAR